jgi:mannitol-1-phosphate 5-dehydrogenase
MPKFLQIGAGNIGRSLCGSIFSALGYEIVFVDVDQKLVDRFNEKGFYEIEIHDKEPKTIHIEPVRAISFKDEEKFIDEISSADIIATAVGARNLSALYVPLAKGLNKRTSSVNVLLCENVKHVDAQVSDGLVSAGFSSFDRVGLITTAIEKMVPSVPPEEKAKNILATWAESYNIIQINKQAICGAFPDSPDIEKVDSIDARYERKLFLANLMHMTASVFGQLSGYWWIADAVADPHIYKMVESVAMESGCALQVVHPNLFVTQDLPAYVGQFIRRLSNTSLKDTVYRGGKDIERKLQRDERLVGPALLYYDKFSEIPVQLCKTIAAACISTPKDESDTMSDMDTAFLKAIEDEGVESLFRTKLKVENRNELIDFISQEYRQLLHTVKTSGK